MICFNDIAYLLLTASLIVFPCFHCNLIYFAYRFLICMCLLYYIVNVEFNSIENGSLIIINV